MTEQREEHRTGEAHLRIGGPRLRATGVLRSVVRYVEHHPLGTLLSVLFTAASVVTGRLLEHPVWGVVLGVGIPVAGHFVGRWYPTRTQHTRIG